MGDKGPQGPPVDGGGMLPYEPFGISSAFTEYNFNNGTQRIVFNQFIPPTNGDYTHMKLYTTNALNTSGFYSGRLARLYILILMLLHKQEHLVIMLEI